MFKRGLVRPGWINRTACYGEFSGELARRLHWHLLHLCGHGECCLHRLQLLLHLREVPCIQVDESCVLLGPGERVLPGAQGRRAAAGGAAFPTSAAACGVQAFFSCGSGAGAGVDGAPSAAALRQGASR
eukprot:CAMPEP_0175359268 /NCGR_PEP_ID=MMETSP0095-20121207/15429_1 /TAXON_ID=311494 /ORGANISM="Alexandrium monilatum, Strain CCMP3105" /LENGTH=128 /DNA_ID=CAMNT_0016657029 /DNA_START=11 /DNA_END=398 /DNA_ORIENTATION=+